jgi:predicted RNase H-like HicB family nuclease
MEQYLIVIGKSGANYGAYSPDVPGCVATGTTVEATIEAIREALEFHLEGLAEDGDSLPQPQGLSFHLNATAPIAEPEDLITHVAVRLPQAA